VLFRWQVFGRYLANTGQIIFVTKLAKNQPLFKHFSNKNNLAGIF
jgi:hypothetical protein